MQQAARQVAGACWECGQLGHTRAECPVVALRAEARKAATVCWVCGLQGHTKTECAVAAKNAARHAAAAAKKVAAEVSWECGQQGHTKAEYQQGALICWHCGEKGHTREDCTRTGLGDLRMPVAKAAAKKTAAKNVVTTKDEPAEDARSDSTVATATDKNEAAVRLKDRITYEQWKEQQEARKAEKGARMPLSKALQILEAQNALCAAVEEAKVDDAESAKDTTYEQRPEPRKARKAKILKWTGLPLSHAPQILEARDVLCVAVEEAKAVDVESIDEAKDSEEAKVVQEDKEEPGEPAWARLGDMD